MSSGRRVPGTPGKTPTHPMTPLTCQKPAFSLDPNIHYINCAYLSPLARAVEQAGIAGVRAKCAPSGIGPADFFDPCDELRRRFGCLVNAPARQHRHHPRGFLRSGHLRPQHRRAARRQHRAHGAAVPRQRPLLATARPRARGGDPDGGCALGPRRRREMEHPHSGGHRRPYRGRYDGGRPLDRRHRLRHRRHRRARPRSRRISHHRRHSVGRGDGLRCGPNSARRAHLLRVQVADGTLLHRAGLLRAASAGRHPAGGDLDRTRGQPPTSRASRATIRTATSRARLATMSASAATSSSSP